MADLVETILDDIGPALSSDVATEVVRRSKVTPATARQRLSRAGGTVRKLAGVPFARNARFMYLDRQFGSPDYWDNLATALVKSNSALGYAIAALRQYGGMVPTRQFAIICGAPIRQLKHLAPETILRRLEEAGLARTVIVPSLGECVALVQEEEFLGLHSAAMRARLITEDVLLSAVRDWLRKLGIASYNLVATRADNPLPRVGTFAWDLSAPSYLGALARVSKTGETKPGFVACDVNLTDLMTLAGVGPFIRKCTTLRALRNVGPCMQILVANRFEREAFTRLRAAGIIPATPGALFGEDVAQALRELTSALVNAANSLFDAEQFDRLFRTLGKIEGAKNQLRGTLFEYMAADMARREFVGEVTMKRIFKLAGTTKQTEIDVLAVQRNHQVIAIECKGYSPRAIIPESEFKHWLHHIVPTAHDYIRQHPEWRNLKVAFEFWTTAPIGDVAFAMFEKAQAEINPNRYTIALRGPMDILKLAFDTREQGLIAAFEKHFTPPEGPLPPLWKPRPLIPSGDHAQETTEQPRS